MIQEGEKQSGLCQVICRECKYCEGPSLGSPHAIYDRFYICHALAEERTNCITGIKYTTGKVRCETMNEHGECEFFEPKPAEPPELAKVDPPLKPKNLLARFKDWWYYR